MSGEEISRALSDVSDEKIESAMAMGAGQGKVWRRIVAVAAVLALVLTAAAWNRKGDPGIQLDHPTEGMIPTQSAPTQSDTPQLVKLRNIVKLYSYNQENLSEEEMKQYEVPDSLDHYGPYWIETVYPQYGIRLVFQLPEDLYEGAEINISISSKYGEFYVKDEETNKQICVGKTATIELAERVTWKPGDDLQILKENINSGELYLHVTIFADGNIVGYGVVEMAGNFILDGSYYAVTLRRYRTFCFPKIDGIYQNVTEEDVAEQLVECEQTMQEDFEEWLAEQIKKNEVEQDKSSQEGDDANGIM